MSRGADREPSGEFRDRPETPARRTSHVVPTSNAVAALVATGLFLAIGSRGVAAQSCFGGPTGEGEFALGVGATSREKHYGGELAAHVNLEGMVDFASSLGFVDADPGSIGFVGAGTIVLDLPSAGNGMCVTAGFTHTTWDRPEEGAESVVTLPAGIALGRQVSLTENLTLLPWVDAGALIGWTSSSSGDVSRGSSELGAFVRGGVGIQIGPVYARLEGSTSTLDAQDADLTARLGWTWRPTLTAADR